MSDMIPNSQVSSALLSALEGSYRKVDLQRIQMGETSGINPEQDAQFQVATHLFELMHEGRLRHDDLASAEKYLNSEEWRFLATVMRLSDLIARSNAGDHQAAKRAKELFEDEENNLTSTAIGAGYMDLFAKLVRWIKGSNPEFNQDDDSFGVEQPEL